MFLVILFSPVVFLPLAFSLFAAKAVSLATVSESCANCVYSVYWPQKTAGVSFFGQIVSLRKDRVKISFRSCFLFLKTSFQ